MDLEKTVRLIVVALIVDAGLHGIVVWALFRLMDRVRWLEGGDDEGDE